MIKYFKGDILNSKANFIICPTNGSKGFNSDVFVDMTKRYPHAEKEFRKYVNYYSKNNLDLLGTVQYIPKEVWALGLVDTIKNSYLDAYDDNYQYFANTFVLHTTGFNTILDGSSFIDALDDIKYKAQSIGAKTIAIKTKDRFTTESIANNMCEIINDTFKGSFIDIEIWT